MVSGQSARPSRCGAACGGRVPQGIWEYGLHRAFVAELEQDGAVISCHSCKNSPQRSPRVTSFWLVVLNYVVATYILAVELLYICILNCSYEYVGKYALSISDSMIMGNWGLDRQLPCSDSGNPHVSSYLKREASNTIALFYQ